ncbi:MAG: hypothetical protein RLZZ370_1656 [Bacteroidota bacterium]
MSALKDLRSLRFPVNIWKRCAALFLLCILSGMDLGRPFAGHILLSGSPIQTEIPAGADLLDTPEDGDESLLLALASCTVLDAFFTAAPIEGITRINLHSLPLEPPPPRDAC